MSKRDTDASREAYFRRVAKRDEQDKQKRLLMECAVEFMDVCRVAMAEATFNRYMVRATERVQVRRTETLSRAVSDVLKGGKAI
jgi:hypothetical protein